MTEFAPSLQQSDGMCARHTAVGQAMYDSYIFRGHQQAAESFLDSTDPKRQAAANAADAAATVSAEVATASNATPPPAPTLSDAVALEASAAQVQRARSGRGRRATLLTPGSVGDTMGG